MLKFVPFNGQMASWYLNFILVQYLDPNVLFFITKSTTFGLPDLVVPWSHWRCLSEILQGPFVVLGDGEQLATFVQGLVARLQVEGRFKMIENLFHRFRWFVLSTEWNVRPLIRRGSYLYFFAALYYSCLGFNDLLALPTKKGGNKGIKSKKGAVKCC